MIINNPSRGPAYAQKLFYQLEQGQILLQYYAVQKNKHWQKHVLNTVYF